MKSPVIVFALVDPIAHVPLKVTSQASAATVAMAHWDAKHGTHVFRLPLDKLKEKSGRLSNFGRELAKGMTSKPNSLYYIADIELPVNTREQELEQQVAALKREVHRLTFELGGVEKVQPVDPWKMSVEELSSKALTLPTGEVGFRAIRKLCIDHRVPDYGRRGLNSRQLALMLKERLVEIDRENAAATNPGGR